MCSESATGTALRQSKKHAALASALLATSGCSGVQSALDPGGPAADVLAHLTWLMVAGAGAILALVMVLAWYAIYRDPDKRRRISSHALIVAGGVAFPVIVLSALLVYGVGLTGALRADAEDALHVRVTSHMWWWRCATRARATAWRRRTKSASRWTARSRSRCPART